MTPGYEYYDHEYESMRDPASCLGKTPLEMVRKFHRVMGQSCDHVYVQNTALDRLRLKLVAEANSKT